MSKFRVEFNDVDDKWLVRSVELEAASRDEAEDKFLMMVYRDEVELNEDKFYYVMEI